MNLCERRESGFPGIYPPRLGDRVSASLLCGNGLGKGGSYHETQRSENENISRWR